MNDPINSPSHYTDGGIECIEAIEASMGKEAFKGFLKGNCVKYLWRYELKNGIEDLRKCQWYLNKLVFIEEVETTIQKKKDNGKEVNYDPDDYLAPSGCVDGFCPMPNVRQGPSEPIFEAVN